jgi:hypothetical protein
MDYTTLNKTSLAFVLIKPKKMRGRKVLLTDDCQQMNRKGKTEKSTVCNQQCDNLLKAPSDAPAMDSSMFILSQSVTTQISIIITERGEMTFRYITGSGV